MITPETTEKLFTWKGFSPFMGKFEHKLTFEELMEQVNMMPVLKAWLEDRDLILLEIASSNIGFIYTFIKPYPGWELPQLPQDFIFKPKEESK